MTPVRGRCIQTSASLVENVIRRTALREIMLSGQLDIEEGDLVRMLVVLTQVKASALKTRHAIETCDMVPGPRVREMMGKLVEIIRQFMLGDRLPEAARACDCSFRMQHP